MITPIITGVYPNYNYVTCQTGEENFWRSYAAIFPLWEVLHKNKAPQQERSKRNRGSRLLMVCISAQPRRKTRNSRGL